LIFSTHNKKSDSKVALIVAFYPLGASSVLLNLITMLNRSVACLDIFTEPTSLEVPYSLDGKARLFIEPSHFFYKLYNRIRRWKRKLFQKKTKNEKMEQVLYGYFRFAEWAAATLKKQPTYDIIIYANYSSIFVSSFLIYKKPATSIYYNLELLDDSMTDYEGTDWKYIRETERAHFCYMDLFFATSPKRAECLSSQANISIEKFRILPVLPIAGEIPIPSKYFYKKFNLLESLKIILYVGSIDKRLLQKEIVNTVKYWPENTVLIFHSYQKDIFDYGYGLSLREIAKGMPVYFSAESLSYTEISAAIASAKIGLAFYDEMDSNTTEIFYSSNKVIEYLRCGVPVITSYNSDYDTFFVKTKCGFSIKTESIPTAITTILNEHETYKDCALTALQEEYSFESFFYNSFSGILFNDKKN